MTDTQQPPTSPSTEPKPTLLNVVKPVDFNAAAPEFVPLAKQAKSTLDSVPELPRLLGQLLAGGIHESQSAEEIRVSEAPEDVLATPTPASIPSFSQLVDAARAVDDSQSADVSMLSMTDDDSDISSVEVSMVLEPKTPLLPLSGSELDDLDISPTGGVGGGVRCGIVKPATTTQEAATPSRVLEGLILQKGNQDPKPKYQPLPPQRSCNIHVQNLPSHYGDAELSGLCEEFGHIVSVRVFRRAVAAPPNRRLPDGQHSTYGFVLFDNVISAENCVNALRQRYKNIYPSFARQAAPAVHQPAFVGLLEAMAYADLHQPGLNLNSHAYGPDVASGLGQPFYLDPGAAAPIYNVPTYEAHMAHEVASNPVAPAYEAVLDTKQIPLVSAPVEPTLSVASGRPRALTIKPMPPPIQSFVAPSTTTDRLNSVLNEGSILLIVDGLPKDFGVGLLDTLFAPHVIHDVRLHRQGASDGVRGSVRVSNRLAALQSIEKLNGMQFGATAGGLHVRLAEEVNGEGSDTDVAAVPALPSYRTLPDVQEYRSTLAPLSSQHGILSSSTSAPAVASMIGSGLNRLLFSSDSCDSLTFGSQKLSPQSRLSPSTGRLLSPGRHPDPFTPAISSSVSMPHVAPRFLSPAQSYSLLPSLRVGNVNLPITSFSPSSASLYACTNASSNSLQSKLAALHPTPEPPVIKVTSYVPVANKATVPIGAADSPKKKSKSGKSTKGRVKGQGEKGLAEIETQSISDEATRADKSGGKAAGEKKLGEDKATHVEGTRKSSEGKGSTGSSPHQPKSAKSKAKKWLSARRHANPKVAPAPVVKV